jgi:hypothetical protein
LARHTPKRFVKVDPLVEILTAPISATPNFKWLTRIQTDFDVLQYFEFFGVKIDPILHIVATDSKGDLPKTCPGLIDLELFFRDPYNQDYYDSNPWEHYTIPHSHNSWFQQDSRYSSMSHDPCHTEVVDWILTFAFPFIKHIPTIRLTGAMKTHQRKKWELIFKREYEERNEQYQSHGFVYEDEVQNMGISRPVYA